MVVLGYARFLANYPYIIVGVVSALAVSCFVVILTVASHPDFSDPKLGFEARGTDLSARIRSHEKLLEETNGILTRYGGSHFISTSELGSEKEMKLKNNIPVYKNREKKSQYEVVSYSDENRDQSSFINHTMDEQYFCDTPRTNYARYTYTAKDKTNLFTLGNIRDICKMDQAISSAASFRANCVQVHEYGSVSNTSSDASTQCCRSWSLSAYVMLINNRSSCHHLSNADIEVTLDLLQKCVVYSHLLLPCGEQIEYRDVTSSKECSQVPPECLKSNSVYHLLHFIADSTFLTKETVGQSLKLTYAMTFIPLAVGKSTEELYHVMTHEIGLSQGNVVISGIEFGLKQIMFDEYLKKDSVWFVIAFCSVTIIMWFYTASLFITLMAFLNMICTLIVSYFFYTVVFEINFFPYMNLMTVVVLIGVGVDDVFLYCRTWNLAKYEKNIGTLEKIISDTLKHATISMLVTSLTTSAAIYANMVNKITALRCFAIFGGTTIFVNFLIMISWIPATIVLHNKWCSDCCCCCREPENYSNHNKCLYLACKLHYKIYFYISEWSRTFFGKVLPYFIVKLRYLWIFLFSSISIGGIIVVLYYPKLKLPSSNEFQMFAQTHPFEVYDFKVKELFWFEKAAGSSLSTVPLTVVWGITPQDTGNKLDPFSKTTLKYNQDFDFNTQDGQRYLLKFCRDLRSSPWYQEEMGPDFANCFIESFIRYMERPCEGPVGSYFPCCMDSEFPYTQSVFSQCLEEWMTSLEKSRHLYYIHPTAGPRFSKTTGQIVAIIAEFNSIQPYSFNYESMSEFYFSMKKWVDEKMILAPKGLTGAWFVSDLSFFDLQHSLATGTPMAIGVSIALATVFAFFTTLNVLITIWAIVNITGTIFTVIGILVLMGWELNIMESVTITVAVGLAIDFTLHYGMAYRLSPDTDREPRVIYATRRLGSVVAAAAASTFVAGLFMLPSYIEAYHQLGFFLMLIMIISWLYATFFFQSLLTVLGPIGGFSQFHCFSIHCETCCSSTEHIDKTVYTMTESTTSSSSTTHNNGINSSSEIHEMEPLTNEEEMDVTFTVDSLTDLKYSRALSSNHHNSHSILNMESTEIVFDDCDGYNPSLYHPVNAEKNTRHKSEESQSTCKSFLSSEENSLKSPLDSDTALSQINHPHSISQNRVLSSSHSEGGCVDDTTANLNGCTNNTVYVIADRDNSNLPTTKDQQLSKYPLLEDNQNNSGSNNNVWVKNEIFV